MSDAQVIWQDEAACVGHSDKAFAIGRAAAAFARDYCGVCPVTEQCLRLAVATESEYGVWGGQTSHSARLAALQRLDRE